METSVKSDMQILQACLDGNRELYAELVKRYQSLICAITYNETGDLNHSEELAQDTFVRAWQRLKDLHQLDKFKSWLCGIARNLCLEWRRKHSRETSFQTNDLSIPSEDSPVERIIKQEEEALLWNAIEDIPTQYREPLILFYREQQSVASVADALELSEDAVKQRLSRGRKMLKESIAAFVESALSSSGPKKSFTIMVMAALPATVPQWAAAGIAAYSTQGSTAMKTATGLSLTGAILGPLIGIMGAIFGIRASYNSAKSNAERQHVIYSTFIILLYVVAFWGVTALGIYISLIYPPTKTKLDSLIQSYPYITIGSMIVGFSILYTAGLFVLIRRFNEQLKNIQIEQGTYVDPEEFKRKHQSKVFTKGNIYGAYGGSIFGCIAWVYPCSWLAGDWLTPIYVSLLGIVIFMISTRMVLSDHKHHHKAIQFTLIALAILDLFVLNFNVYVLNWGDTVLKDYSLIWLNALLIVLFGGLSLQQYYLHRQRNR